MLHKERSVEMVQSERRERGLYERHEICWWMQVGEMLKCSSLQGRRPFSWLRRPLESSFPLVLSGDRIGRVLVSGNQTVMFI
jgi:hypothetical protein